MVSTKFVELYGSLVLVENNIKWDGFILNELVQLNQPNNTCNQTHPVPTIEAWEYREIEGVDSISSLAQR